MYGIKTTTIYKHLKYYFITRLVEFTQPKYTQIKLSLAKRITHTEKVQWVLTKT